MYDYGSKYTKGRTDYLCPAPLPEAVGRAVQDLAVRAHRVLGCSVYSRVDFRLSPEGEPFVLEVNTAPGMTDTSLVPKAAAAAGWSFPELVDRICRASFGG
jgi:D-alanine-D-alanine ligase